MEDATSGTPTKTAKTPKKGPNKVIVLDRLNGFSSIGAPKVFKVMRDSAVVQALDISNPEVRNISVTWGTWENFVGGIYHFVLEGDVTNLDVTASVFNYDCVFDLKA